jgi:hypothetical protein
MKTEQVRLPVELMNDVRLTCPAFGEAANEYVARAVRELLRREMSKAAKVLTKRAAEQGGKEETE